MPVSSQVLDRGRMRPSSRLIRELASTRKTTDSTLKMYLVATARQPMAASNRCWRAAGARHSNNGVPGDSKHKEWAAKILCR